MRYTKEDVERASETLKDLRPGDTLHTILRSASRSGMSRVISVVHVKNGDTRCYDWAAAVVLGWPQGKREGIKVGGCGMDMGFHLVYELSSRLFPKGYKLPKGERGRNGNKSGFDKDGGYALRQRWL